MHVLFWVAMVIIVVTASGQPLTPADSELTVRTTSSVDIQVCVPGVLSDRRAAIQALCLAELQFLLGRTTAVYLIRQSTTATGAVCWVYVYQSASPSDAANTEFLLSQQVEPGKLSLTDSDGQIYACATHVVPWQGESPPLPYWDVGASDLITYGAIVGGTLAFCLLILCCLVLGAGSNDTQRASALLREDRRGLRQLLLLAQAKR